jgi:hypothetical protein
MLAAALVAGALLVTGRTLPAQEVARGSRFIATDNWTYEFIERLRERGYLRELNPMVQPYQALEIARGLTALDPDTLPEPVVGWVQLLRGEFWRELRRLEGESGAASWGVLVAGGARASTSQRLDPMRPTGDEGIWPWYNVGAWGEAGPIAAEVRLLGSTYLEDDPDGVDPGQRRGGRTDHAYVSADFKVARLTLGRLKRNWMVFGRDGLLVSDVPTAYPQLALEFRLGRFALRSFTGELDTLGGLKRYLAGHRLDYQAGDFVVSFGESILYATRTGPQLRFLNPLEFLFFDHDNLPDDVTQNLVLEGQVWYRTGGVALFAEFMLDDIDVSPDADDAEPLLYGLTLGGRWTSAAPWLALGLDYQRVSAFVYRTQAGIVDQYSFLQRGLGENFSDYDRLSLSADLYPPVVGLWLTPVLQVQRQGEGDLRDPLPPRDVYLASPTIFLRPLAAAQVLLDRVRPGTELGPQQGPRRGQQRERVRGGG